MQYESFAGMLNESSRIVFFGGAGVSTESNIPDFRSESGIYSMKEKYGYSPEVMLSHSFFMKHTDKFYDFYRNKLIYRDAKPNAAHLALADMERMGRLKAVITQNIDGLHQMAGSKYVVELHGSVHRNFCMNCGKQYDLDFIVNSPDIVPRCEKCNGVVKPDVVLYEEELDAENIRQAVALIKNADMLIVGGTSLVVYPAAGLVQYYRGDRLVLINKSSTPYDGRARLVINDSIGKVLSGVLPYVKPLI